MRKAARVRFDAGCLLHSEEKDMLIIKDDLFMMLLILVSIRDIKTRIIPDYYHVAILVTGFIDFKPLFSLAGILAALPFFIAAVITKGKGIGGADIKFMAAAGFAQGFDAAIAAAVIGLVSFVLFAIINNGFRKKGSFPMIPFLAFGFMIRMFIYCGL